MFQLSRLSYDRLSGVDDRLIRLVELAIQRTPVDFGIAWRGGFRTMEQQRELFERGVSQKDGYQKISKHQKGEAVDILPYTYGKPNTEQRENYLLIIGVMFSCANELSIEIRSGANWDRDQEFLTDQNFDDFPHIELINV